MSHDRTPAEGQAPLGALLVEWRARRRISQMELSFRTGISTKHLSFVETGRANPSRALLRNLCDALDIPLRSRNELFLAAGFSPAYRMTPLSDESMADAQAAITLMLEAVHPCGAVAFDGAWNIVMVNRTYREWVAPVLPQAIEPLSCLCGLQINLLNLFFANDSFRSLIVNWEQVAAGVAARVKRELASSRNAALHGVIDQLGPTWQTAASAARIDQAAASILPVELKVSGKPLRLFNTVTTLGSAVDISLRELRIETFHPVSADDLATLRSHFETHATRATASAAP
jgi:transcriptional regulator with XRE-family HTH domain